MKYSIIIPVYNAEKTLERCVESVLSQSFTDYEIILVNDGSHDKSGDVCKRYSEEYKNIVFIDKENGGASSARNAGLDKAQGDYILFIDSDDYVDKCFFEVIDNNTDNADLVVLTFSWIRKNGIQKRNIPESLINSNDYFEQTRLLILTRAINSPCAKVFKRAVIDYNNLRFDERMPVAEDFVFCTEYLMKCNSVAIYNLSIYFYDVTNNDSLVRKKKDNMIDAYPIVFDREYEIISDSSFTVEQKQKLFKVWDKLHTDSFATCVMEELKDENIKPCEVKRIIKNLCEKFYSKYYKVYGYENIVHYLVRLCIKYKMSNTLYYLSRIYMKYRR